MKKSHSATAKAPRVNDAAQADQEIISQENLAEAGGRRMQKEREEYNAVGPSLSGGDIDANWQDAEATGEETIGGHVATPDQDSVDEIGQALGIEIPDEQELHTHDEILARRDRHRWELNQRSIEDDFQPDE